MIKKFKNPIICKPLNQDVQIHDIVKYANGAGYYIADTQQKVEAANRCGNKPQQVLFTSSDEIKEGDKAISKSLSIIEVDSDTTDLGLALLGAKKIIASYPNIPGFPTLPMSFLHEGCKRRFRGDVGVEYHNELLITNFGEIICKWVDYKWWKEEKNNLLHEFKESISSNEFKNEILCNVNESEMTDTQKIENITNGIYLNYIRKGKSETVAWAMVCGILETDIIAIGRGEITLDVLFERYRKYWEDK